jgi:hypothetical protein
VFGISHPHKLVSLERRGLAKVVQVEGNLRRLGIAREAIGMEFSNPALGIGQCRPGWVSAYPLIGPQPGVVNEDYIRGELENGVGTEFRGQGIVPEVSTIRLIRGRGQEEVRGLDGINQGLGRGEGRGTGMAWMCDLLT